MLGMNINSNGGWNPAASTTANSNQDDDATLQLVIDGLSSFWHVPAVNESETSPPNSFGRESRENEQWKAVGSPPSRGFGGRSASFSSSPGSGFPSVFSPSQSPSHLGTSPSYNPWAAFEIPSSSPSSSSSSSSSLSSRRASLPISFHSSSFDARYDLPTGAPPTPASSFDSRYADPASFLAPNGPQMGFGGDDTLFALDEYYVTGLASASRNRKSSFNGSVPLPSPSSAPSLSSSAPSSSSAAPGAKPISIPKFPGNSGASQQHHLNHHYNQLTHHNLPAPPNNTPASSLSSSSSSSLGGLPSSLGHHGLPAPSSFGSTPRGWAEVASMAGKGLNGSHVLGVSPSSVTSTGSASALGSPSPNPAHFLNSEQFSPRKMDGFGGHIGRRSSTSEFDYSEDFTGTEKRRSSFQKNFGTKERPKKTDYGFADPILAQDHRFYRVEFKSGRGGVYYLEKEKQKKFELRIGDFVMVEADRGKDLGIIAFEERPDKDAKKIFRLAKLSEINELPNKTQDEAKALSVCQAKIKQRKLPMEVVEAEYQWDRRKLTYYFVADRRIDFRELVRELFKNYKTRIWMCSVEENRAQEMKQSFSTGSNVTALMNAVAGANTAGRFNDELIEVGDDEFVEDDDFPPGSL